VADARPKKIGGEHAIAKNAMDCMHHEAHYLTKLVHTREFQTMQLLVLRLFKQGLDPALVGSESSGGTKVTKGGCYHASDAS